jgi:hypothetical protein
MENGIVNKVAQSKLVTFNLEEFYQPGERVAFDIKDLLFQGLVLKEKDFRDFVKSNNWNVYRDKHVAIICSADAIVPTWAFMLLAVTLQPVTKSLVFGSLEELESSLFLKALDKIDWHKFEGAKVVIKGCSKVDVPTSVYVEVTSRLRRFASSIMYGEPCSTVPLFKKRA